MKLARVTGTVVSTVKYEKYRGMKLLKVRHLDLEMNETGEELVALDAANAGIGDIVLVNNDGGAAQMVMGDKTLIASVTVCGVIDSFTCQGKTTRCHG
jgi:microcompartment protein CcmK/EutM